MKNYTYRHVLEQNGYIELPAERYSKTEIDMKNFVKSMSPILSASNSGWDGVRYAVLYHYIYKTAARNPESTARKPYMVLYTNEGAERYIPIEGNSKACNFSVLGENIW